MALACRSFASLALLASASRLRAPKASRPLTATLSGARSKSTLGSSKGGRRLGPSGSTSAPAAPPFSEKHSKSARTATADHRSAPPRQRTNTTTTTTSPPRPSPSSRGERPLLEPYELSRRLIELCKRGDVDLAVAALQEAPRNAQNIKVWNTIIQQCMEAQKYKLAYTVFTDMKRRGFMPNVRTCATMMSGYATIDDWSPLSKQLELVHSVYGQLKQQLEQTRNSVDDPAAESNASFILYPIALYISILGKAGKYQTAFDVFHGLDTDGPLAPHPKIYSSLLSILADRVDSTTDEEDPKAIQKSVSEAKYIWRRHLRSLDKQPQHDMQPRSVDAMIKILSRSSQPSDHELMYDILRDICGLPRPGEKKEDHPPSPSQTKKKVSPTPWILQETLYGCIAVDRPEMAVHYAQYAMDSRELRPILWAVHLRGLVRAHVLLAKKEVGSPSPSPSRGENVAEWVEWMVRRAPREKMMPRAGVIVYAFELCYLCRDLPSAIRIARAIINSNEDSEGPARGGRRGESVPIRAWEHLFHLASVASPDEKRQCLELLSTHGGSVLDIWEPTWASREPEPLEKKAHVFLANHIVKMLEPVPSSPDHEGAESPDAAEPKAWSDLRRRAELFLKKKPKQEFQTNG